MEDYQVIIDCGHGGIDTGIVKGKCIESQWTLAIAKNIHQKLNEQGIPTLMIRSEDQCLTLEQRIFKIKHALIYSKEPLVLSIHGSEDREIDIVYPKGANCNLSVFLNKIMSSYPNRCHTKSLPENGNADYYAIQREIDYANIMVLRYPLEEDRSNLTEQYAEELYDCLMAVNKENGHLVQKGETLWTIAKKYHKTVQELMEMNRLDSSKIRVRQRIMIEDDKRCTPDIREIEYLSKKGENVYSISNQYGVPVEILMNYSGLKCSCMEESQLLVIPISKDSTVKIGANENAYHIAKKYHTTKEKLLIKNGITDGFFMYGEVISI